MKRALALATVIAAASLAGCSSYREERVVTGAFRKAVRGHAGYDCARTGQMLRRI